MALIHELHALLRSCLPLELALDITALDLHAPPIHVAHALTASTAVCPVCSQPSTAVQSAYQRHLADLPWGDRPVQIRLRARKFFCCNAACRRRMFTERIPTLPDPARGDAGGAVGGQAMLPRRTGRRAAQCDLR